MAPERKGHGSSTTHGHGHKTGRPSEPPSKKQGKGQAGINKQNKPKQAGVPEEKNSNDAIRVAENEAAVTAAASDPPKVAVHNALGREKEMHDQRKSDQKTTDQEMRRKESEDEHSQKDMIEHRKCNITPENFNVKEFNTNMTEFIRTLEDPRYTQVDAEYPVEDLVSLVAMVTKSVSHYKVHSSDTQRQLEDLRNTMRLIKEKLHFSVTRQALNLRSDLSTEIRESLWSNWLSARLEIIENIFGF